jgi:hypothetical protein
MIEVAGCLGVRAFVDASDELNSITAATAGETTPEISFKVDPKGSGIVSSMKRTRAGELIAFCLETRIQSVDGKDLPDGNTGFKEAKAVGVHTFLLSRAGLICAGLPGVEFKEELFVQFSELSLGSGLQKLSGHHIEYSQVSETMLGKCFLERFCHEMRCCGLLQGMVEIGHQVLS